MKKMLWMVPAMAGLVAAAGCNTTKGPRHKPVQREQTQITEVEPVGTWKTTQTTEGVGKKEWVPANQKPVPAVAQTTPYTVQRGDTLTGIAQQYGLRWQDVAAVNPGLNPNQLRVNQTIYLPGLVDVSKKAAPAPRPLAPAPTGVAAIAPAVVADNVYVVKSGDTLSQIAQRHGVKTADLKAANNLKSDVIRVNQKLTLPAGAKKDGATVKPPAAPKPAPATPAPTPRPDPVVAPVPVPPPPPVVEAPPAVAPPPVAPVADAAANRTHTVQEKEDIFTIALHYGVTPTELRELNNINVNNLVPGTELQIPPPAIPAP